MVWHKRVDLYETNNLNAGAIEDLLIRDAKEKLAPDQAQGRLLGADEGLLNNQREGKHNGHDRRHDETENDADTSYAGVGRRSSWSRQCAIQRHGR